MTEYDNSNKGALWGNKTKELETHADLNGSALIVCPGCGQQSDYWMNSWKRKPEHSPAAPALKIMFKPKVEKVAAVPPTTTSTFVDDDIPF